MSSPEKESTLLAGHPPAVKAGGMRITQHKAPTEKQPDVPKYSEEDEEEYGQVVSASPPKNRQVISGFVTKGDADFPPEAVQAFHNKPTAAHEYRFAGNSKPNMIQQPRKQ